MGFLEAVQTGAVGLRLALPGRFAIENERKASASLVDLDRQAALMLFHFDLQLDLRREHQALLVHDIQRHARELFVNHFALRHGDPRAGQRADIRPRTEDPHWSPVVSIERVLLGTSMALSVVHRMAYEHGLEIVMGHLLVPLQSGLFEFRVIAANRGPTGVRESLLSSEALAVAGVKTVEEADRVVRSVFSDDPRYDSRFPDHPLSVVRSMLRMLATPGVIQLTQPEPPAPANEVVLPEIGSAITPPRRYVRTPGSAGTLVRFSRVAFAGGHAGTDGVQELVVIRLAGEIIPEGPQRLQTLVASAEKLARSMSEDAPGARVETWTEGDGNDAHALAHTEFQTGVQGEPRQRLLLRVFTGAGGVEQIVMLRASACVPKAELLEELEAVIQSWRPLGATRPSPVSAPPPVKVEEKKKKKWWWF